MSDVHNINDSFSRRASSSRKRKKKLLFDTIAKLIIRLKGEETRNPAPERKLIILYSLPYVTKATRENQSINQAKKLFHFFFCVSPFLVRNNSAFIIQRK